MLSNLELSVQVKFNRALRQDDTVSLGGFRMETEDGKELHFDFFESYGGINVLDATIWSATLCKPDFDSFPKFKEATPTDLFRICKINEIYVDTGDDETLYPIKIVRFTLSIINDYSEAEINLSPLLLEYNAALQNEAKYGDLRTLGRDFKVTIEECRKKVVSIWARDEASACQIAMEKRSNQEIVLSGKDVDHVNFKAVAANEEADNSDQINGDSIPQGGITPCK